MLEKILGIEKVHILQCQVLAKKIGFGKTKFDLCGPTGRLKARWIDAYLGFFEIEGQEEIYRVSDIQFVNDIWCENIELGDEE